MENFDKEKVLSRVKKMMAIANDAAASEGERDNALRMAHNTLAKYNLTMAQAEATGHGPTDEPRTDGTLSLREYAWMRSVAQAIGNLFFCSMFVTPLPKKHAVYVFVGRGSNVFTAVEMTRYVLNSINQEAKRHARAAGETPMGNYWRNFCKGAAGRIYVRCAQLRQDSQQQKPEVSTGTSLVLASVYQNELALNTRYIAEQMHIKLKTGVNRQRTPNANGFFEGQRYGDNIGLDRQLT